MGKRADYWLVAWGGFNPDEPDVEVMVRYAGPCPNSYKARKDAYGIVTDTMTVIKLKTNPRYMPAYKKNEIVERAIAMHKVACIARYAERKAAIEQSEQDEQDRDRELCEQRQREINNSESDTVGCEYDWV